MTMTRPIRTLLPVLAALLAWSATAAAPVTPAALTGLTGFVRDTAGRILAGSIVLALPVTGNGPLTTTTLDDGRYLFNGLTPGSYRITAVKSGYLAGTASVNTLLQRTLDLVLAPGTQTDGDLQSTSAWMLRVPPRDVLRETGFTAEAPSEPAVSDGDPARAAGTVAADDLHRQFRIPLNGEVQQWFSSTAPAGREADETGGQATSLRLAMRVSERLDVSVAGERDRRDQQTAAGSDASGRTFGADHVGVSVGYELDPQSRLDMRASYSRNSLLIEGFDPAFGEGADSESVTRSCGTNWQRIVGQAGRLDVSALYADEVSREQSADLLGLDLATSRFYRAEGSFRTQFGPDHMVSVGVRASMFEPYASAVPGSSPGESVASGADGRMISALSEGSPLVLAGPAPPGWAVHVHGGEEWSVSPQVGLDFGIDYLRSLSSRESSHLVPQAGTTWRPAAGTSVKAGVSWLADWFSGSADSRSSLPSNSVRQRDRLGYGLLVEQRLWENTVVSASASARPISYEYQGADRGILIAADQHPLYLSDGLAQIREAGVEVRHRFGGITTRSGATWGRIEGLYAAAFPGEPLREMHQGLLLYRTATVAAATHDGGTEARLEYRTLAEQNNETKDPETLDAGTVSLQVSQALDFVQLRETRWRLMLAWQNSLDSSSSSRSKEQIAHQRLLRPEDRVSGGVSVRF